MHCKVCGKENKPIFNAVILDKYDIQYFYCENCSFLQTEEPYWLDEAYEESINVSDTGYMQRNLNLSHKLTILLRLLFDKDAKFLDYAGGYGVFVRMMRDIGFDFCWDDKFTTNIFAKGFEYKQQNIDGITTFESFEHYVNPIEELENLLLISKTIIFSTELIPVSTLPPKDWWYYGFDHGQHISFFSAKTFNFIAKKYKLNYCNLGSLHILTDRNIPAYTSFLLKLSKFGGHKILRHKLVSKTWKDSISKNI